ncbi:MAG: 30S ribosome-binding factor RbfA [Elusimicrobia bacterium]|nr:30S ribosome-binding factor RbfA [Elusimicrobiota bacterium]
MPSRKLRLAEVFKQEFASWLARNPAGSIRGLLTITEVRVSQDLEHCTVYFSVFGSEEERLATSEALAAMAPQARRLLGKLRLKQIPTVEFRYDDTPAQASRVEQIFDRIKSEEKPPDA